MFNGNKLMSIEDDLNLINKKINENNRNEKNYHFLNNKKRELSYDIIQRNDDEKNKNVINLKNNRPNSHKKEDKRNFPNILFNIDLNNLPTYNNENDGRKKNSLLLNDNDNKDISPEKYLEDILAGNENDIIVSFDNKNYFTSNILKSSKEFDILKNTLFNDRLNTNKLSKSLQITSQNNKLNKNESEPNLNKEKIVNHDDIPIVVNNTNFMDLLEKELANENIYNLKYNNKSWDISKNKNSCNLSENSLNNKQNFMNKKENYDRDDYDNKEKIKFTKIINNKKIDLIEKRSRTPDNSSFKKTNKRKIFRNNNFNINNNINNIFQTNINTDNKQNNIEKDNINNNIVHNNKLMNPLQQRKIKNIINNNSITIISHFDIEENSIKKNSDIYNNNLEIKQLNDSTDKDITNYMCEEDEEKEKKELFQKKINELNYEISKYKEERNNLNKTKMYYEKLKSKLNSDLEIFNKQKEEFKNYIINELEKVKIKQQKYKSNNKIIKNLKTENEILIRKNQDSKELIESLKNQISQLQQKIKSINININNNFINKKTSNHKFQNIEEKSNYNASLSQFLTKEDNNKNDDISHGAKLYRNRSSLRINKSKEERMTSERRLNTFLTEKDIYSIKTIPKEDESFEINNINQDKKINIINGERKNYSSKAYEMKNFSKIKTPLIIENKNENDNIITKEKYNNILKLINNSFKNNKERNTKEKSFIERINELKLNHTDEEKTKKITKCKSNININPNQNKNKLQHQNIPKKVLKYTERNNIKEKKLSLEEFEFKIPEKYKNQKYKLTKTLKAGDKIIKIYNDNKKEIIFPSGVRKEIFKDGYQIIYFVNGDIKQNYPNGKSIYYFKQAKTVQTTFKNGIFVVKFENNQVEKHYPNGKKQILFPDGSEKIIFDNGNEQNLYTEENNTINN